MLSQRLRNFKRHMECPSDIGKLNFHFLLIYESLIPEEGEKAKQKQLLTLLEKLVSAEWPKAQLFLYGSCANSFGVSKSDIDVCLAIDDAGIDKSEFLLKLADILQADNLQNVQVKIQNLIYFSFILCSEKRFIDSLIIVTIRINFHPFLTQSQPTSPHTEGRDK